MSIKRDYGGGEELPLGWYAGFIAVFGLGLAAVLGRAKRRGSMPERVPFDDAALMGVATHAITRIVTKDWVTAPLRAPFVKYERSRGAGEVEESSRGHGLRRAIGDLLTCPYCTGPWVALGLIAGYLEAPRATRTLAWLFSTAAASSWLHRAYGSLEKGAPAQMPAPTEPEIRIVHVPHAEPAPSDGASKRVMTEHVDISPDDVPEGID